MIRVYLSGPHSDRSPLSYPALAPLFSSQIKMLPGPDSADLLMFSHSLDLEGMSQETFEYWSVKKCPIVLLSEEPFWDTIWGKKPLHKERNLTTPFGPVPVTQLNHHTSDIFNFDQIPYYLLTNLRFASAYAHRFRRNAAKRPSEWRDDFAAYPIDISFMAERRREKYHNVRFKNGDIIGLCAWRSELASACKNGVVKRLGQSWDRNWNDGKNRFDLRDWHLDKLTKQDRHNRLFSALENTHQPNYLSEKLFDAFALGARPFYFATPNHRVHDLGLPQAAWINLYEMSVANAAHHLETVKYDAEFFESYTEAQQKLEYLFTNPDAVANERDRLKIAVQRALADVINAS